MSAVSNFYCICCHYANIMQCSSGHTHSNSTQENSILVSANNAAIDEASK